LRLFDQSEVFDEGGYEAGKNGVELHDPEKFDFLIGIYQRVQDWY
jgi:hypothetical protein